MKHFIASLVPCFAYACGTVHMDHRNRAPIKLVQANPMAVDSVNNLPDCNKDFENRLVYIKELDLFRMCNGQSWIASHTEQSSDQSGVTSSPSEQVIALRKFVTTPTDLCPSQATYSCYFNGGSAVKYADGSIKYRVTIAKSFKNPAPGTQRQGPATENISVSMLHLPAWDASNLILLHDVSRNSITSDLYLHFDALSETFFLVFDSDQDGSISERDELLLQPTLLDL